MFLTKIIMELVPVLVTRPSVVHLENPVWLVMEIANVVRVAAANILITAVKMSFAIQVIIMFIT